MAQPSQNSPANDLTSDQKTVNCETCTHACSTLDELNAHTQLTHSSHAFTTLALVVDRQTVKCKVCTNTFSTLKSLKAHTLFNHSDRFSELYPSHTNTQPTKSFSSLVRTFNQKFIECGMCADTFDTLNSLKVHTQFSHPDRFSEMYSLNVDTQNRNADSHPFRCENCPLTFVFSLARDAHFKAAHPPYTPVFLLKCKYCEEIIERKDFRKHTDEHKNQKMKALPTDCRPRRVPCRPSRLMPEAARPSPGRLSETFTCRFCERVFYNASEYLAHTALPHLRECPVCGDLVPMSKMMDHVSTPHLRECFVCKKTVQMNEMRDHIRWRHPEVQVY